eukprot:evm.model.scf_900.3 EVM.evm.TU.scf_900.3   scf_900:41853-48914(+)
MRPSSARGQDFEALARRRSVAAWIEKMTGVPLPTANDYSFRSSLKDGVLLCRVMNKLSPYSIAKVCEGSDDEQGFIENIDNFLMSAEKYGVPNEILFAPEEITEGEWEDRPRVAECLYHLERYAAEHVGYQDDGPLAADRPYSSYESGSSEVSLNPYEQLAAMAGGPESLRSLAELAPGMDGGFMDGAKTKGIGKLMEQCSSLLRDRTFGEGITSPTSARRTASPHPSQLSHAPAAQVGEGGALRSLEGMLKQVLEGITTAQEKQGRSEVEQMEKYTRSLEQQIELLQNQQPVYDPGYVPEEFEMIQRTAEDLSIKLEEYEIRLEHEHKEKTRLQMQLEELRGKVDSVANINEKYAQIQEENRKLYNLVQDLRGNIRVFCRCRPMGITGDQTECCVEFGEEGEVAISNKGGNDKRKVFKFDKIFDWSSQQDQVYCETQPLIRSVLDGYNVCIFAYGQTGSGKTHTMSGTDVQHYKGRGINYRSLDDLFQIKRDRADEVTYDIRVQMLEIYNEVLRDLLTTDPTKKNRLDIMSTEKSGENVPEATQMRVDCTDDVLRFMDIGAKNRAVGSTKMNQRSSRSHSVLTVVVDGDNTVTGVKSHGCLHLVDLAGSERLSRSEATGDRLEEAKHINKSLSALGDVMSALAQKSNHVPYRNSKLTQLLQDSLSGQAKAMMFMHIAPESSSRGETLSTLMFGARVSQITLGQAKKNTQSSKIYEAREAMDKLNSKAEKKQERIEELEKVVETERAVARSAMSEKEALERQLAELRAELDHTKRAMQNGSGSSVTSGGLKSARRRASDSHDAEPPTPGRRLSRTRSGFGSSETPGRTSSRPAKDVVKPLPSLSQRSNSSRDSGPASARHRRSTSAVAGRTPRTTPRTTPRSTPRNTPFTPRNTPFVPSTGDKSARRTGMDSSRENSFTSGKSRLESSGSMLRRAQAEKVRTPARAVTQRENTKPRASGTTNPRRATATLRRDTSSMSSASSKSLTRGSSGGWR